MNGAAPRAGYGLRLGIGAVLLVVAVVGVVLVLIERALARDLVHDLDHRLEAQARGAAAWSGEGRYPERLAPRLAAVVGARVTILDPAGRVLGDSDPAARAGSDESGVSEIASLTRSGEFAVGRASRRDGSRVVRFVALRAPDGKMLRLGASLAPIEATLGRVRLRLLAAAGIGVALAVALAAVAARLAARPLLRMRDAAHRIADGDYAVSLAAEARDEFGELESSLAALAARLAADRDRIERLETSRRNFVADVSHELRTPLTAIQGYAETLLRGTADPEKARQFLETMHRQARRLSGLVTQLLQLAELEGRSPDAAVKESVRLADVASQAVGTVRDGAPSAPAITVDVDPGIVVRGDPAALEQIIENLVENTVRYGARPIDVRAKADRSRVVLTVSDGGPGIAPEHLPRLFDRFYRVDPGTSREAGGTGLGLAIVKQLAEGMGGTARVESAVGEGTTFVVELPGDPGDGATTA